VIQEIIMLDAQDLAERYVAVWNESESARRRQLIVELWVPEGRHYVGVREAIGYDALEQRVTGSHNKNVRDGGHRFRAAKDARGLRNIVTFRWEMLRAGEEQVVARGLEVLMVGDDGRFQVDYQFVL
jgi:hypothetical protein